jgi:pimeloyl-ACP methyl ester carboxylesterase
MAVFVVAHGAWTAGWSWKKMHPLLHAAGHRLVTPTLTGLGERAHLAHPQIDLATHIEDVLAVLHYEDLHDVTLIGHSYGGMVATGVADRARARIVRLVYLDAFVPEDGESLFDLQLPDVRTRMREQAEANGEGWRIPPNPMPADTAPDDFAWANPRRRPQPIRTYEQPVRLTGGPLTLPRHYIWCRNTAPQNFRRFYDKVQNLPGWRTHALEATHNPHITVPDVLRDLLGEIVRTPA